MFLMRPMPSRDTVREIEQISDRLNRLLGEGRAQTEGREESMASSDWTPLVDVMETDAEFQIRAELPGVDKEKVKLSVEDGVLTISGLREPEKEEPGRRYHRLERAYGSFARSFAVPDTVDQQKVTAEFKNGLLTVRLPKSEKARPKSITVTVG
jgi:HSP20 family protein